jgi:hypothetical protein
MHLSNATATMHAGPTPSVVVPWQLRALDAVRSEGLLVVFDDVVAAVLVKGPFLIAATGCYTTQQRHAETQT